MPGRARRILRKTLRWSLRIALALITVVLALAVLLLYSPGFLHFALNLGLGFYNARIPGEITIGRVEGRLADHLVLGDIFLADGDGRALVVARELTIDWTPWDLLHGRVTVSKLALSDAQVHLVAGGGFGDLAIPGPESPPRETIAPSLPIELWVGSIDIKEVDVLADSGESIVGGVRLAARDLGWSGLVAHLTIDDGAAKLPGLQLEALALTADYGEPRLQLSGLVTTELGSVELVRVDLDAETMTGASTRAARSVRSSSVCTRPCRAWRPSTSPPRAARSARRACTSAAAPRSTSSRCFRRRTGPGSASCGRASTPASAAPTGRSWPPSSGSIVASAASPRTSTCTRWPAATRCSPPPPRTCASAAPAST
jgi:hypothetical protein